MFAVITHGILLLSLGIWLSSVPVQISFSNYESYRQFIGPLEREVGQSHGRYLHSTTQDKHRQISMPRMGLEPTIPVFERTKTFCVLDREATMIGLMRFNVFKRDNFHLKHF
jgi:hypothetical protein